MIEVLLNGCCGKMGKTVTEASKNFPNIEIIAGIDKFFDDSYSYKIFNSIENVDIDYDVLLDFQDQEALQDLLNLSLKRKSQ